MISDGSTVQVADRFLGSLIEQLDAIVSDARRLTEGLTPQQLNWRPDARRWSIGQCLEHITLTARLYPAEIERMIGEARERAGTLRPYREGWFSRWMVTNMEPPPRLRVRTKRSVDPASDLDRDAVLRDFENVMGALRDLVRSADGTSLRHGRMRSPFAPILRFTLAQTFAINTAHARRHLWQARQVRQHANFPAS
jgi:hypothetical protein